MPKFTSQILLLFSKVLHILKASLKNFTGLKVVVSWNSSQRQKCRFSFSMQNNHEKATAEKPTRLEARPPLSDRLIRASRDLTGGSMSCCSMRSPIDPRQQILACTTSFHPVEPFLLMMPLTRSAIALSVDADPPSMLIVALMA